MLDVHRHFVAKGYTLFEQQVLDPLIIAKALQSAEQVLNGQYDTGYAPWAVLDAGDPVKVQRVAQIHIANHILYQLVTSPVFAQLAAQATQANTIKIWGSQLYYKPQRSGSGGVVGYHRDSEHMPYFASGAVTAWIPLNHFQPGSGPLHFIAGSHRWTKANPYSGAQHQSIRDQQKQLQDFYRQHPWREESSVIQAGNISFHHQDTLHGSPENHSDTPRWALGVGLLVDNYQLNPQENDYGFAAILNNPFYCPTIYRRCGATYRRCGATYRSSGATAKKEQ